VGTLNINGLQRKKTDLRFLLQQTRCDVMAVQETGDSARTAFVGPFQGGTQGEEEPLTGWKLGRS
jgi:hypothetical protein